MSKCPVGVADLPVPALLKAILTIPTDKMLGQLKWKVLVRKESGNFARTNSAYRVYCNDIPPGRGLVQLSYLWAWPEMMSQ